ncbi:MAG: hypothetical protein PVI91_11395 [Gammaproteobacteria bacterium]|jgi:hypothetical protein
MTDPAALLSDSERSPSVRDQLTAMLGSYRAAASTTADLAAAELRLAASTTLLLLALAIAIALFATSAWLLSMLAVAALIAEAPRWPAALLGVAGANLAVAGGCWIWMRSMTRHLTFPQLRAVLAGQAGEERPAEDQD